MTFTFPVSHWGPSTRQDVSIDFDGATEGMANTTSNAINIVNQWTIATWVLNNNDYSTATGSEAMIQIGTTLDRVLIQINFSATNDPIQVLLNDDTGTNVRDYRYESTTVANTWYHVVMVWDGTAGTENGKLTGYVNASVASPTRIVNTAGASQAANSRPVGVGSNTAASAAFWQGRIFSTAIWSSVLSANEITAIYNGHAPANIDLLNNFGNYVSAANLQHWWRLGLNSNPASNIGKDYGIGTNINISTNAANISAADVVADFPT